ncbi:hypothetical protein H6768_03950 [Candidatus Peribacteria bacterium]|nr:hypothetical protein [Candidatus Peribacteria bacterium]
MEATSDTVVHISGRVTSGKVIHGSSAGCDVVDCTGSPNADATGVSEDFDGAHASASRRELDLSGIGEISAGASQLVVG